jgi:uncharacterized protein DUF3788
MEQSPHIGDRLTDKSASPNDATVRDWVGPEVFGHWVTLQDWIEETYPGVFAPTWLYGGEKHGWSLRYKKSKAFCTFLPEYKLFSVVVVLGAAEREKFEERRESWRPQLVKLYDEAQTYHDGKWLKVEILSTDDRHDVMGLLSMKRRPSARG